MTSRQVAAALTLLASIAVPGVALATPPSGYAPPPPVAQAQQGDDGRWTDRPWMLNVHIFSFGAPAGTFAVELERSITKSISIAAGTGLATGGQQVAGMMRWRHITGGSAFGVGAGLSYGDQEEWLAIFGDPERREDVTWGNGEMFWEGRSHAGFHTRVYLGYSKSLDGGPCTAGGDRCDGSELPVGMPYMGFSLGSAF